MRVLVALALLSGVAVAQVAPEGPAAAPLPHLVPSDPALTAELQRMIDDVNIATHACMRFADGHEATDAAIYQDYMSRAVEHLHRAKAILEADLRER